MDISEKQAVWREQKPLFEAEFIHSHLLPFFNFNENTGDYEIKSECVSNTDDEDRKVAYEALNTGWVMWLRAKRDAKAQAVPAKLVLELEKDRFKEYEFKAILRQSLRASKITKSKLNWVHVMSMLGTGSTVAHRICEALGVNPDGTEFKTQEPAK